MTAVRYVTTPQRRVMRVVSCEDCGVDVVARGAGFLPKRCSDCASAHETHRRNEMRELAESAAPPDHSLTANQIDRLKLRLVTSEETVKQICSMFGRDEKTLRRLCGASWWDAMRARRAAEQAALEPMRGELLLPIVYGRRGRGPMNMREFAEDFTADEDGVRSELEARAKEQSHD